jgi:hypothetical protein
MSVVDDPIQLIDVPNMDVIERAKGLNDSRESVYGHPRKHFTSTGRMWAAIISARLGVSLPDIPPETVALMFDADKTIRLCETPWHQDSMDDKVGYTRAYERCFVPLEG